MNKQFSFRLGRRLSDIFILVYLMASLALRWQVEPYFSGQMIFSIGFGLAFLAILWALIKARVLNPSFLGNN